MSADASRLVRSSIGVWSQQVTHAMLFSAERPFLLPLANMAAPCFLT